MGIRRRRGKFAALDTHDRAALQPILVRTGCWNHSVRHCGRSVAARLRD